MYFLSIHILLLTTGTDVIPAEGQDNSGDDTIEGVVSAATAEGTLQGTDTIDGDAGSDTLKLDMQKTFDGFTTGSMKNVETVELVNKSVGAIDFVAKGVTGVTSYVVDSTKGAVNLKSLAELAAVDIKGPVGDSAFAVEYTATSTVATGTQTDTQVLKVTDVGTINTAAAGAATNAKFMDVTIAKVEALEVTTAGTANSLNFAGVADAKAYKVSGAGQTEIEAVGAAITSFDASGATGNVIADLQAAGDAKLATLKSGTGNDVLTVALGDLTTTAVIDGGTGTDRLDVAASGAKTLQATMSGVETIRFTAPAAVTGAVVFSGTNVSDLAKAEFKAGILGANVSFVNQKAAAFEVALEGAVTTNTVAADAAAAITANISNTATATAAATANTSLTFDNATGLTVNVNKLMEYNGNITTGTKGAVTVNVASNVVSSAETTEWSASTPGTDGKLTANTASSITVNADGGLAGVQIDAAKATTVSIKAGATAAASLYQLSAAEATTLNLTVGSKGLDMEAAAVAVTNLDKVQTLTATNSGHLDFTGVDLKALSTATVTGSGDTAQATFDKLGDAAQTYNLNLTVTGQKAGLTTTAVDAGTGAANVNISGVTGNATMTTIKGAAGVTLNANKLAGTFNNGANAIQATAGNVTIDVGAMEKAADIAKASNIIAGDATGVASNTKGNVTVTATNAIGAVTTGDITGDNVSIDATNALGAVTIGNGVTAGADIFAKTSVTYKGATLGSSTNAADIQAVNSSTALTVDLSGGAGAETFTVKGSTAQESITVKGNVGAGTNSVAVTLDDQTSADKTQTVDLSAFTGSDKTTTTTATDLSAEVDGAITYKGSAMNDTITIKPGSAINHSKAVSISDATLTDSDTLVLDGTSAAITLTNLSLSGIEKLNVADDTNAITINASAVSAKTMEFSAGNANDVLNLTGTAGNDVIDLGSFTKAATAPILSVKAAGGNDTIVASTMKDIFVYEATAAANGVDTITGFAAGGVTDQLDFTAFLVGAASVLTTAADATTADLDLAAGSNTVGILVNDANGLSATDIVTVATGAMGEVILADDGKAVVLTTTAAAANTANTYNVYYVEDTAGVGTQNWVVTLVGTVTTDAANMAATGNFA